MTDHSREAAGLLLSSMHRHRHPERRRSSFMVNEPGRHPFGGGGGGTEVNFDGRLLMETALYVQQHGSPHLKGLPVDKVESDLMGFVTEAYHLLAPETFLASFQSSYADRVSDGVAMSFADAFAASRFFVEPRMAAIFPLVPVRVDVGYDAAPFFFCAPGGLAPALGPLAGYDERGDTRLVSLGFHPAACRVPALNRSGPRYGCRAVSEQKSIAGRCASSSPTP